MMRNIKNILETGAFMLLTSLSVFSCTEKSDWNIDSAFSRPFGTDKDGISVTTDEKVARATISWSSTPGTDYYIIEISPNELTNDVPMGSEENGNKVFGITPEHRITKSPYTIDNLEVNKTYYLRIKSIANNKESNWVYGKKTFNSVQEEAILNIPSTEDLPEGQGKVRISWEAGLIVDHFKIQEIGTTAITTQNISVHEIDAGEAWIEHLKPFSAYIITIYNGEMPRGTQNVTIPGLEIESTISGITESSAIFSWEETVDVNQYACVPSSQGAPNASSPNIKTLNANEISAHKVTITGLTSNTEYTAYAFANGAICSRTTFTTKKGKPSGYTEMTWEEALTNWSTLTGDVLISLSGTGLKQGNNDLIVPANVTNLIFWGEEQENQVDFESRSFGAAGKCEKIEFHNIKLVNINNSTLIYQNDAQGCFKEVAITSCVLTKYRGIFRVAANVTDESTSLTIDDCIIQDLGGQASGSNHYGILLTDKIILSNLNLTISNTSFINAKATNSSIFIRTKSDQTGMVTIKDCTFYDTSSADALFRDSSKLSTTIYNTLFAKGGIKPFYDSKAVCTTLSVNGLYKTSDFTFGSTDWGKPYVSIPLTSEQIFPNGASNNLTFATDVPEKYKIGDPRWKK